MHRTSTRGRTASAAVVLAAATAVAAACGGKVSPDTAPPGDDARDGDAGVSASHDAGKGGGRPPKEDAAPPPPPTPPARDGGPPPPPADAGPEPCDCCPFTCAQLAPYCGIVGDGCGGILQCDENCAPGFVCSASTVGQCVRPDGG